MVQILYPANLSDCPAMQAEAARQNDALVFLKVFLDGEALANPHRYRLASTTCFEPYSRILPEALAASDCYWIRLRPLAPGEHLLEFRAFYTNPDEELGDMVQNIAYTLTIGGE